MYCGRRRGAAAPSTVGGEYCTAPVDDGEYAAVDCGVAACVGVYCGDEGEYTTSLGAGEECDGEECDGDDGVYAGDDGEYTADVDGEYAGDDWDGMI